MKEQTFTSNSKTIFYGCDYFYSQSGNGPYWFHILGESLRSFRTQQERNMALRFEVYFDKWVTCGCDTFELMRSPTNPDFWVCKHEYDKLADELAFQFIDHDYDRRLGSV